MPLSAGQWSIDGLVLGPGTVYRLMTETNPFVNVVRAEYSGPRPWGHGSYAGAEWLAERVVPIRLMIETTTATAWLAAHQALAAAFAAVGDTTDPVEARFVFAGTEFLLLGRPRMVEPDIRLANDGRGVTKCAFVALDPLIYSGLLQTSTLTLPAFAGGLTVPFEVPLEIESLQSAGIATITNSGTADAGLTIRIDGPVGQPTISLRDPSGDLFTLRLDLTLLTGEWVEIDTRAETVFLLGEPTGSRRHTAIGDFFLLPPGASTVQFNAADATAGTVTLTWRHAWF